MLILLLKFCWIIANRLNRAFLKTFSRDSCFCNEGLKNVKKRFRKGTTGGLMSYLILESVMMIVKNYNTSFKFKKFK